MSDQFEDLRKEIREIKEMITKLLEGIEHQRKWIDQLFNSTGKNLIIETPQDSDSPFCPLCGSSMERKGRCYMCPNCLNSTGSCE